MIFDNKKKGGGSHRVVLVAQGDEGNGKIPFMVFSPFYLLYPHLQKKYFGILY